MQTPAKAAASVLIAAGIFFAGYLANRQPIPVASSGTVEQVTYYTCPMHPQYKSDHPGECPICGMRLVPAQSGEGSKSDSLAPEAPGAIQISAAKQQLVGIRTDEVRKAPVSHGLRVPGRIAVDEQRSYRIIAGVDGWIRDLANNPAGSFVKKDQILASYYAQGLIAAAQTYVFALQTNAQALSGDATIGYQRGTTQLSLNVALDSLRALGMSEYQVNEIQQTRIAPTEIHVYSPINGFVLARNISPEQRFDKGAEMYRIADIGHIWVMTDIFEKDREFLKPGALATILYQGREFEARMSDALPQFDPQSRTLKTRFELENPGLILRPDMFVDVEVHAEIPEAVTVPADSVIDLGSRKIVYVSPAEGMFEPRAVQTGWRLGDRVQIVDGLEPGERIVTSSNFLVDSESRMRLSAAVAPSAEDAVKDPVCGMKVDPNAPGTLKVEKDGRTWFFCSDKCKHDFETSPAKYVQEMAAQDGKGVRGSK